MDRHIADLLAAASKMMGAVDETADGLVYIRDSKAFREAMATLRSLRPAR